MSKEESGKIVNILERALMEPDHKGCQDLAAEALEIAAKSFDKKVLEV